MTVQSKSASTRIVIGNIALSLDGRVTGPGGDIIVLASSSIKRLLQADALDRLSITLCPEVAGGGAHLFEDGLPRPSWTMRHNAVTTSGALCLLYDRVRDRK